MDGVTDMSLLSEALSEAAAEPPAGESQRRRSQTPAHPHSHGGPPETRLTRAPTAADHPPDSEGPADGPGAGEEAPEADWAVSLEQFVASVLTEPLLVAFFERRADVTAAVTQLRSVRLNRQTSLSLGTSPPEAS